MGQLKNPLFTTPLRRKTHTHTKKKKLYLSTEKSRNLSGQLKKFLLDKQFAVFFFVFFEV